LPLTRAFGATSPRKAGRGDPNLRRLLIQFFKQQFAFPRRDFASG